MGQGRAGVRGVVVRTQLEPDQKLSLWIVVHSPGVVATQAATPLEGDEGDHILLAKLNIVNTRHFFIPEKNHLKI